MRREDPHLLPPLRSLPDPVHELVHRLKVEWPRWGTRWIAGQLARLGVKASRSSVQRTPDDVYRGRRPRKVRNLTAGRLHVQFLDGDSRLPVLRPQRAA